MSHRFPLVALAALAAPAAANTIVWVATAPQSAQSSFGSALAVTSDHDADGFPDLIVGSHYAPNGGSVQIRSGRTGALIVQMNGGPSPFVSLGWDVWHVDDADGDGVDDVLATTQFDVQLRSGATGALIREHTNVRGAGALGDRNGDGRGDYAVGHPDSLVIRSGADGSVLSTYALDYPSSLVDVGDVTGDGVPDLALTHIVDVPFPGEVYGRMSVFSGASGAEVFGVDTGPGSLLGRVTTVADLDGDGKRDVAFAHPDEVDQLQVGRVVVHSSANGALLRTIANPHPCATISFRSDFGSDLAEIGDVDQDGVPDLAVTSNRPRGLWVFSGANGALRMAVETPHTPSDFPIAVAGLPDVDGDGRAELVYGDPGDVNGPSSTGSLFAVRGTSDNSLGARACFGDGSGAACPCGNTGGVGQGCANTTGAGATLSGYGSPSIAEHDLWFLARGLPGGASGSTYLFFGTSAVNGGLGAANFAGLRCAGGSLRRTGQHTWKGGGVASWVPNIVEPLYMSAGVTYHFQSLYRDVTSPCAVANFTNLVSITLAP